MSTRNNALTSNECQRVAYRADDSDSSTIAFASSYPSVIALRKGPLPEGRNISSNDLANKMTSSKQFEPLAGCLTSVKPSDSASKSERMRELGENTTTACARNNQLGKQSPVVEISPAQTRAHTHIFMLYRTQALTCAPVCRRQIAVDADRFERATVHMCGGLHTRT